MAGALILRHHHLEAIDGAGEIPLLQVPAADVHFLGGELVAADLDLLARAFGIFGVGELARDLLERRDRALGAGLVAGDVRDLVEIGGADQVLRIGGVRAARMQRDVALGGVDRLVVGARGVIRIGRHDQPFARPFRIGVLAVDLLELLGGVLCLVLDVEQVEALVVEAVGGLVGRRIVLGKQVETATASAQARRQQHRGEHARETAPTGASGRARSGCDYLRHGIFGHKLKPHPFVSGPLNGRSRKPRCDTLIRAGVNEKTRVRQAIKRTIGRD